MASASMTRKEEIHLAALKLMRTKGYIGTSMRDIASALNLEASSLYNHIREKEEFLRNACFSLGELFVKNLNEILESNESPVEKLNMFIRKHLDVILDNPDASYLMRTEWKQLSEPYYNRFVNIRDEYEKGLKKILKDDEINNKFELRTYRMIVITILSALNSVDIWYNPNGEMTREDLSAEFFKILVTGIKQN